MDNNFYNQYGYAGGYQAPQQKQYNQFSYVNGIEGARAFPMMPDSKMLLLDQNEPIFYMKVSNVLGQSIITTYRFEEVPAADAPADPKPEYITRYDLKPVLDRLAKLEKTGK